MPEEQKRCFVISPIGEQGTPVRKNADIFLKYIIEPTLTDLGYSVERGDQVATPGMINDHMIHSILEYELAVADMTALNANVFYELGLRHMSGKPVIHMAAFETSIPFDNMGHRAIFYEIDCVEGHEAARSKLKLAVQEIEQPNYRVSNPITQANAAMRRENSSDTTEQSISSLQKSNEELWRVVSDIKGILERKSQKASMNIRTYAPRMVDYINDTTGPG
jgi:hypothetical protein